MSVGLIQSFLFNNAAELAGSSEGSFKFYPKPKLPVPLLPCHGKRLHLKIIPENSKFHINLKCIPSFLKTFHSATVV